jgi:hypothetical protein
MRGVGQETAQDFPSVASITAEKLRQHVQYLASDALEGREAGSRGGHLAGDYVREHLTALAIPGSGPGGTLDQPFGPGYRNILGLLEGSDAGLKRQVVIIGAHYDHVGRGTEDNSQGPVGEIHNGADDNASGTAVLLELAEALARLPEVPNRSILLAFWDAEEKETLGSRYWIAHPTVPLDSVVAVVNMDMVGRLRGNRLTLYGSRTGYGLRRRVSQLNQHFGLDVDFSRELEDDGDHYAFFGAGIPVLFPHTGLHDEYHSPRDDTASVDADGMRRIAGFLLHLVYDLAQRRQVPVFRPAAAAEAEEHALRRGGDPFGRSQRSKPRTATVADRRDGGPLRLGISFREDEADPSTVVLTGIVPGLPADRAGLRPGDRVYEVSGSDFRGTHSFLELAKRPAESLQLLVERDGRLSTAVLHFPATTTSQQPVDMARSGR